MPLNRPSVAPPVLSAPVLSPPVLASGSLLKAACRLMRPLVRLMILNGLTFPVLADSLRRLFVDIAVNDLLPNPKVRTDSRISLLTGVHRKEIRRLRDMPADSDATPASVTLISQIIARWVGTARFTDGTQQPLRLPRSGSGFDQRPSFDELVASVTTDIRPRTVLDDLLGHGVVFMDSEDCVQLNIQAFIPRAGGEEQLFYFARNLHDHVAAAVANISVPNAALFLDRSVHYDGLTLAQAQELQEYARAVAMQALLDVNRRALGLTEGMADGTGAGQRVNFGVYVFDEAERSGGGDRT